MTPHVSNVAGRATRSCLIGIDVADRVPIFACMPIWFCVASARQRPPVPALQMVLARSEGTVSPWHERSLITGTAMGFATWKLWCHLQAVGPLHDLGDGDGGDW